MPPFGRCGRLLILAALAVPAPVLGDADVDRWESEIAHEVDYSAICRETAPGLEMLEEMQRRALPAVMAAVIAAANLPAPPFERELAAAEAYLNVISANVFRRGDCDRSEIPEVNFNTDQARDIAKRLLNEVAAKSDVPAATRSAAYVVYGRLAALIARKLRSRPWAADVFDSFQKATQLAPDQTAPLIAQAKGVLTVRALPFYARPFVTKYIGVDLGRVAKETGTGLRRLKGPECLIQAL